MGAKIKIEDRTAIIKCVRKLIGTKVRATDLRGSACLILAGLIAKNYTQIDDIKYILRGYENLEYKLKALGSNITKYN